MKETAKSATVKKPASERRQVPIVAKTSAEDAEWKRICFSDNQLSTTRSCAHRRATVRTCTDLRASARCCAPLRALARIGALLRAWGRFGRIAAIRAGKRPEIAKLGGRIFMCVATKDLSKTDPARRPLNRHTPAHTGTHRHTLAHMGTHRHTGLCMLTCFPHTRNLICVPHN